MLNVFIRNAETIFYKEEMIYDFITASLICSFFIHHSKCGVWLSLRVCGNFSGIIVVFKPDLF